MKKLILTDLDHTLLKTDGTISERTLDVLKRCREKGCTFVIATAIYWIGAELSSEKTARSIAAKFGCKLQCYRGGNWYGFLPKGAGKTAAITALAEKCGIALYDTIAFGDDRNDIEMLEMCGTGVAVANAVDEVLDIADEVTESNDEDGAALWLEREILG